MIELDRFCVCVVHGLLLSSELPLSYMKDKFIENFDMPLIRCDTDDLVEATGRTDDGLVTEFAIKEGRSGDFVEDKNGKKIPLTALIFGRHHKAFDVADHVQIGQTEPGKATLYVTAKDGVVARDLAKLFDLTNVDIDFDFKVIDKPIRTTMGKLKLRV